MNFSAILSAFTGLLGVVLGILGSEYISNRELKINYIKELNKYVSDYLALVKTYHFYCEQYIKNKRESATYFNRANEVAMKIQVTQNYLDIVIKDNNFSPELHNVHAEMTQIVTNINDLLNGPSPYLSKEKLREDISEVGYNYLMTVNKLINDTMSETF